MFYNAKNGNLKMDNTDMDYISFGTGKKALIIIPGLGDGLTTVRGKALPFAWMYRMFAKDFTVYVFSRKNELEEGYTNRDMALDMKKAMEMLGVEKADVVGVSQGGMIAECFAIDYPKMVNRLILTVTIARQNDCIQSVVGSWIDFARQNKFGEVMKDVTVRMYTEEYVQKYRFMVPLLGLYPAPKNPTRFITMATACITHDVYDELEKITAPTLVIGGCKDRTVGTNAAGEIAEKIKDSELLIYPEYGHGLYNQAKDFNQKVYDFLTK